MYGIDHRVPITPQFACHHPSMSRYDDMGSEVQPVERASYSGICLLCSVFDREILPDIVYCV